MKRISKCKSTYSDQEKRSVDSQDPKDENSPEMMEVRITGILGRNIRINEDQFNEKSKLCIFLLGTGILLLLTVAFIQLVFSDDGFGGVWFSDNQFKAAPKTIGLVLPNQKTIYYEKLVERMYYDASYYEWNIVKYYYSSDYDAENITQGLIRKKVDAIIFDPYDMTNETIREINDICSQAAMPCVTLVDEGEEVNNCASYVLCDLEYLGAELAFQCERVDGCVICGDPNAYSTASIQNGLSQVNAYDLFINDEAATLQICYVNKNLGIDKSIRKILRETSDPDAYIVADKSLVQSTVSMLSQMQYSGMVYCFTDESAIEDMQVSGLRQRNYFFAVSDITYYCMLAVANQIEHGMQPQSYKIYPYGW